MTREPEQLSHRDQVQTYRQLLLNLRMTLMAMRAKPRNWLTITTFARIHKILNPMMPLKVPLLNLPPINTNLHNLIAEERYHLIGQKLIIKALLIGINYFGTSNELKGCINDVRNLAPFLHQQYGFLYEDMVILTDDQLNPASQPTRTNIIRACQWLVAGARSNDSLFLHFSGHGGQTEDLDEDEEDGLDETIYPVDFKMSGMIVDYVLSLSNPTNDRNYMISWLNHYLLDVD